MKRENIILRIRLSDIESQLLQMETDSDTATNRRTSTRLKQERQRRLMKEKETIQESLDLIIYPILGIPVEITSEIFLHCLPVVAARPDANLAPMLLGRICRKWRQITCNTPRLWGTLRLDYWGGDRPRLNFLVQNWLRRAGGVSLSLNLSFPYTHCSFFESCLCRLSCPSSSIFTDHWGRLTSFSGLCLTLAECADLLLRASRLIQCEFLLIRRSTLPARITHILLADLEILTLGTSTSLDTLLLDFLTLPRLCSLRLVSILDHPFDDVFLSFLQGAPGIQTFRVHLGVSYPTHEVMTAVLSAMPALCSFELHLGFPDAIIFDMLRLLNESIAFLPRLQNLVFFVSESVPWEDRWTPILVDALNSRWEAKSGIAQLVDFEFQFIMDHTAELDVDISDCVLKLRERGMRIYVGPPV
ncbi:F-box domain-containing protein [Mycena venus]|uniref:F-box domain-containing protein n=1 Tax=Mycena venus TaxID=2733690 RepID=A0A8H6Z0E2_9AGAR|nr:F-box domain-containing protein [Mycena venus]